MKNSFQLVIKRAVLSSFFLASGTVSAGVAITGHPANQTMIDGGSATFQVDAVSTSVPQNPLLYQWFKFNGVSDDPVSPQTTSNKLILKKVQAAQAGIYKAIVTETGTNETAESDEAILVVNVRPVITKHPAAPSEPVLAGSDVPLEVELSNLGTPEFTYTWQKKAGKSFVDIGETTKPDSTDVFILNNVQLEDATAYRVKILNPAGTPVFSKQTILKINTPPVLLSDLPAASIIPHKGSLALKLNVGGNKPFTFTWFKNDVAIPGGNKPALSVKGTDNAAPGIAEGPGTYRVEISNNFSPAGPPVVATPSGNAVVRVIRKPVIVNQPGKETISLVSGAVDHTLSVTMSAEGDPGTLNYQWFKDNKIIPGAVAPTLSFTPARWQDRGSYKVVVTNEVGKVSSKPAVLTVVSPPLILAQTTGPVFGAAGKSVKLEVVPGGTPPFKYEWFFRPVGQMDFGAVPIGKSAKLTVGKLGAGSIGDYKCVITSTAKPASYGSEETVPVFLQVDEPPKITQQITILPYADGAPATARIPVGEGDNKLHLRITASGTDRPEATPDAPANPLEFQWQKNKADIPGQTGDELIINNVEIGDSGKYRCLIKNAAGMVISKEVTIIVSGPPAVVGQPGDINGIEDTRLETALTATGTPSLKYQWQKRSSAPGGGFVWDNVSKATTAKLIFTSAQVTHSGVYKCIVSNDFGQVESQEINVTVQEIPLASTGPVEGLSTVEFFPTIARGGERVRIFGANLQYTKLVRFGDFSGTFVIESDNSILVTVPNAAPLTPGVIEIVNRKDRSVTTTNTFRRTTDFYNNLPNATILPGVVGSSQNLMGNNSFVDDGVIGRVYYLVTVPKKSSVFVSCGGGSVSGTKMDPSLEIFMQVPGVNDVFLGPDGVSRFPFNAQLRSNYVGNIYEYVNFTTEYDGQQILIMVRSSLPPGVRLVGFGPFSLKVNVSTALSALPASQPSSDAVASLGTTLMPNGGDIYSGESLIVETEAEIVESAGPIRLGSGGAEDVNGPVLIWDGGEMTEPASGAWAASFTMSLEPGGNDGDDHFGWQFEDAEGNALGALWVHGETGAITISQPDGTMFLSAQKITPSGGAHLFEISADTGKSRWAVLMDGVFLAEDLPLPTGVQIGGVYAVWDLGDDGLPGGSAIIFNSSGSSKTDSP